MEEAIIFNAKQGTIIDYDVDIGGKEVIIPSEINGVKVKYIGENAFRDNNLTSVEIPDSVNSIGENAFSYNNLMSLEIPGSVTSIGDNAFFENNLMSVAIPYSVKSIGENVFDDYVELFRRNY